MPPQVAAAWPLLQALLPAQAPRVARRLERLEALPCPHPAGELRKRRGPLQKLNNIVYIHKYIYIYIHTHTHIYIYIYDYDSRCIDSRLEGKKSSVLDKGNTIYW